MQYEFQNFDQKTNQAQTYSTVSLLAGASSFVLGFLAGLVALITGVIAIKYNYHSIHTIRKNSMMGIILGVIGSIFWIFIVISLLVANYYGTNAKSSALINQAKANLRGIYAESMAYYAEYMDFPDDHEFNDCSVRNNKWKMHPDLEVRLSNNQPFTYRIRRTETGLIVEADGRKSYNSSLRKTGVIIIDENGNLTTTDN